MSGKRSFHTLSQIDQEEGTADVHFPLRLLSPVKKPKSGTEYFDYYNLGGFPWSTPKETGRP